MKQFQYEPFVSKAILLILFWAVLFQNYRPVDLFGYIVFGEWMIDHATIINKDIFSFTVLGNQWINHEWFFHLLIGLAYRAGNWGALQIFLCGIVGLLVFLIGGNTFNQVHSLWLGILNLIFPFLALLPGLTLRPQMITFLLLVLIIPFFLQETIPETHFILIPCLFVLWANTHGGFIFGLAFMGALIPFQFVHNSRHNALMIVGILVLSSMATLINPYGFHIWEMIYSTISEPITVQFIDEWKSTWSSPYHSLVWAGLTTQILLSFFWSEKGWSKSLTRLLPLVFVAYLALWPKRNLAIYGIMVTLVLPPIESSGECGIAATFGGETSTFLRRGFVVGALIASIYLFSIQYQIEPQTGDIDYPHELVNIIEADKSPKRILIHYPWAEWLIYQDRNSRVFLDGRWTTVYSKDVIQDYIRALLGDTKILRQYNVNWVLLPEKYYLNHKLSSRRNWRKESVNKGNILWRKRGQP